MFSQVLVVILVAIITHHHSNYLFRSDIIDVGTASEWTALLLAISLNLPITVKTLLDYGASASMIIQTT